ncbi:hypothetical protein HUJ05_007709 [Dendroctonus ponderosae]|nr:hypothetical protein HUJ05_007709 [Dendroctonus ponderosae]
MPNTSTKSTCENNLIICDLFHVETANSGVPTMVQLEAKCTAIVKYSQTQYTRLAALHYWQLASLLEARWLFEETQRICEINHAQYNNKGQDTLDIVSRKIKLPYHRQEQFYFRDATLPTQALLSPRTLFEESKSQTIDPNQHPHS